MTLVALVTLGLLVAAASLLAPVGVVELRQGRDAFRQVAVESAAEAALVQNLGTRWVDSTTGAPPGTRLVLANLIARPGLLVSVSAEAVGSGLWLVSSRSTSADASGVLIAVAERGLLLRVGVSPADTVVRARLVSRPWVTGFE